jgi:NAD(P)-dependent dehydrogenase (short-subunit alcohol dehydrogenase family)
MPNDLKTIIVTGASQGIGAALVKTFLERDYSVVASSRNMTRSSAFVPSDKLALVDGDIGQLATATKIVETATSRFRSIDALINNAGIFFSKAFTDYTTEDFEVLSSKALSTSPSSRSNRWWRKNPAEASLASRLHWLDIL